MQITKFPTKALPHVSVDAGGGQTWWKDGDLWERSIFLTSCLVIIL